MIARQRYFIFSSHLIAVLLPAICHLPSAIPFFVCLFVFLLSFREARVPSEKKERKKTPFSRGKHQLHHLPCLCQPWFDAIIFSPSSSARYDNRIDSCGASLKTYGGGGGGDSYKSKRDFDTTNQNNREVGSNKMVRRFQGHNICTATNARCRVPDIDPRPFFISPPDDVQSTVY